MKTITEAAPLEQLLGVQRTAFRQQGPPPAGVRRDRLDRLAGVLLDYADEYAAALDADFGSRPEMASLLCDVAGPASGIPSLRKNLARWMRPRAIQPLTRLAGLRTTVTPTPLGVVGVIGPWNFPIGLVVQPAAEAIAAGNRVMIKFSEVTPRTAGLFRQRVAEAFDPAELTVVTGGPEVGAEFSRLPFDHLFFTGSPAVGRLVQRAAAENLVPVTLELGGKNPVVVSREADFDRAAGRIAASKLVNGGQVCLCPDLVFVPEDRIAEFADRIATAFRQRARPRGDAAKSFSIVNSKNYLRIVALIEDARDKGAHVIDVVPEDGPKLPDPATRRIAPTLVLGVTEDMRIAHEEIFGPVLAIHPYRTVAEVIEYLSTRPSPLVSYWYGRAGRDFDEFRTRTHSGGMTRNDFALQAALSSAPFGGIGQSGMGAYHGRTGFDTFSHQRTVTESSLPWSMTSLMLPPLPARAEALIRWRLKSQRAQVSSRRRRALPGR